MKYEQIIKPKKWAYIGGWCEGFVEGSFGQAKAPMQDKAGNWFTAGVFPSATIAWAKVEGRHKGEQPPKGVYVPVYFSLGSTPEGHVAYIRPDGKVISSTLPGLHTSGYVHPNMQDLIDTYARYNEGCKYLGWSEYVGNAQVVKKEEQMKKTSKKDVDRLYKAILGRPAEKQEVEKYYLKDWQKVVEELINFAEKNKRDYYTAVQTAKVSNDSKAQGILAKIKDLIK